MTGPIINKYLKQLDDKLKGEKDNFFYAFRGQPSSEFELNCSAVRKFDKEEEEDTTFLREYQSKLISDFRLRGFGFSKDKQREFYDLELLGDLRHYGAPSCLMDFTSDFLIALWFACEDQKYKNKNGRVFILNCYETDKFSRVSSGNIKKELKYFFEERFRKLWYWVPERLNQRLTDQDAIFIFGKPIIKDCENILIKQEDKKEILEELERFFDYSKKTLFSDRYALGSVHADFGTYKDHPEDCLEEAVYHTQTGNFKQAKALLSKITKRKNSLKENKDLFLEAHFQRAWNEIENIKEENREKSSSKEQDERLKEIISMKKHFQAISLFSMDDLEVKETDKNYIKDFKICLQYKYKTNKIRKIKEECERNFNLDPNPKQ